MWDPHNKHTCVAAAGNDIKILNTQNNCITMSIKGAHGRSIYDVDYNPNKPNIIVTSGDDNKIKYWDLRNPSRPLKTLAGHHHWVWSVKYNPFHDQLLIRYVVDVYEYS